MCGIAGVINNGGGAIDPGQLGRMTDLVAYRGPDAQGFILGHASGRNRCCRSAAELGGPRDFAAGLGLGHRRLSILDLSDAGHQPMSYDGGNYWIVFNGEIFNYVELAAELRSLGHSFATRTDTEVILAAYAAWGDDCVQRFNGMWAFAIWDVRRGRLFCARDRWGIKPFYYRWSAPHLAFGSEIKQLLDGIKPKAHSGALYDLLVLGYSDHAAQTCVEGIQQLPPAHCLTLSLAGGDPVVRQYYQLKPRHDFSPADLPAASRQVADLLADSVKLRLRSDVPVGSCLSGGLDSSTVVALMARLNKAAGTDAEQHTFTFVSTDPAQDESGYAGLVARTTGVLHHRITPSPEEVRAELVQHLWHMDEPVGGMSTLAQWSIFKAARARGVPVMLDGQGGDELFLGYERYYSAALRAMLGQGAFLAAIRQFTLAGLRSRNGHVRQLLELAYFQVPRLRAAWLARRASGWLRSEFVKSQSLYQAVRRLGLPANTEDMQVQEVCATQLPHLLRYEDRNSMAFSIEARLPMLDYRLVETAVGLPWQLKLCQGWTKMALRQAVAGDLLPDEITWRKNKFGFEAPQNAWMKLLESDIHQVLAGDLACAKFVDAAKLHQGLKAGTLGSRILWEVYNLEQWFRLFGVSSPPNL